MKPLGMTPTFQIVRPTPLQDKIYDAVEYAIERGCSVEAFLREVRDDWMIVLDEKKRSDERELSRHANPSR